MENEWISDREIKEKAGQKEWIKPYIKGRGILFKICQFCYFAKFNFGKYLLNLTDYQKRL